MPANSNASNRRFFLDTEFIAKDELLIPISIGLVDETGREFYAEVDNTWRDHADAWILENVAPHLQQGSPLYSPLELRARLTEFVGTEPAEFWAYFAAYDWVVVCQLMGGMLNLPASWSRWVRDLAWLDPSRKHIRALRVVNPKPHHALFDARELRDRYVCLSEVLDVAK